MEQSYKSSRGIRILWCRKLALKSNLDAIFVDKGIYRYGDGQKSTMVTWTDSLSEMINALISVGLTIEEFKEFPYSPYNCFEGHEFVEGTSYYIKSNKFLKFI